MGGVNERQVVLDLSVTQQTRFQHLNVLRSSRGQSDWATKRRSSTRCPASFSAVLTQLTKAGRVRHVSKSANRQFLWEIAA